MSHNMWVRFRALRVLDTRLDYGKDEQWACWKEEACWLWDVFEEEKLHKFTIVSSPCSSATPSWSGRWSRPDPCLSTDKVWMSTKYEEEVYYSWAGHFKTHLKTHSGERQNKCNQCDFASSRAGNMRTRLKHIWKRTVGKSKTNGTSVIIHPLGQIVWWRIWKHTVEKSKTNATSVIMHPLRRVIWGHVIWKHTVEKGKTNVNSVILHPLGQAIWGHIWKRAVGKSKTNATSVIIHPLGQIVWWRIWKHTAEKSKKKCNQCDYASSQAGHMRTHLKTHSGEKQKKCNQCDYASSQAGHLRTHLKTHSGERQNKCKQCDFASSRADSLRTHAAPLFFLYPSGK